MRQMEHQIHTAPDTVAASSPVIAGYISSTSVPGQEGTFGVHHSVKDIYLFEAARPVCL